MHIDTFHRIVRTMDRVLPVPVHARIEPVVAGWAMRRVPDRRFLEQRILPLVVARRYRAVLFVGTSRVPDTRYYHRDYEWGETEFWTMDIAAEAGRWGADRHMCGDICKAGDYWPTARFDCVILNGVLGWGVNTEADQERAIEQCRAISNPGALLTVGWNVSKCDDPRQLSALSSQYEDYSADDLPTRKRFDETDHVFDVFTARR